MTPASPSPSLIGPSESAPDAKRAASESMLPVGVYCQCARTTLPVVLAQTKHWHWQGYNFKVEAT